MRRLNVAVILGLLVVAAGVYLWTVLFPGPEKVIRKKMTEIAQLCSWGPNEAPLAKLANSQKLMGYFSPDIVIVVDLSGRYQSRLRGDDELRQALMGARNSVMSLSVEFVDVTVKVGPDKTTAIVDVTVKARAAGEREDMIQELQFSMRYGQGGWRIYRVDTVRPLSFDEGERVKITACT